MVGQPLSAVANAVTASAQTLVRVVGQPLSAVANAVTASAQTLVRV
jgi:hypothetical protein